MPATPTDELWDELSAAVDGVRSGDARSWDVIVRALHQPLVRAALAWGADPATAADAVQQTWLAALTHLGELRDARALGGWLRTILRRELLKEARHNHRETPCAEFGIDVHAPAPMVRETPTPEAVVLRAEEHRLVRRAHAQLAERDRELLGLVVTDQGPGYAEISRRLRMPVGSIGPTRGRCLGRLRRELEHLGVCTA